MSTLRTERGKAKTAIPEHGSQRSSFLGEEHLDFANDEIV
jgi:hypothetical protein